MASCGSDCSSVETEVGSVLVPFSPRCDEPVRGELRKCLHGSEAEAVPIRAWMPWGQELTPGTSGSREGRLWGALTLSPSPTVTHFLQLGPTSRRFHQLTPNKLRTSQTQETLGDISYSWHHNTLSCGCSPFAQALFWVYRVPCILLPRPCDSCKWTCPFSQPGWEYIESRDPTLPSRPTAPQIAWLQWCLAFSEKHLSLRAHQ